MKNSIMALALGLLASYAQVALALHIGPTPIETFERPLFKSAPLVRTNSHAAQYAGRTTIASGSVSQVVSTFAVGSDSNIYTNPQVAVPAGYVVQGRTAIASGLSTGTASTTAIYSGDVVALTWESTNAITSGQALRVDSIVGGVSFSIATANSLTVVASGAVAMWKLQGREIGQINVNTISPAGFFTLAWADGRPRALDVPIMWEIRRST